MKRQWVIGLAFFVLGLTGSCLGADSQKVVVIRAGRLFVGTSDDLLSDQLIVIQGDRIAEVGPAATVKVPAGAEVVDLGKATLLPGMIDGHAHMFKWGGLGKWKGLPFDEQTLLRNSYQYRTILATVNEKVDLNAGFTSERDMMSVGAKYSDVDVKRAINEGFIPGPRLQVATEAIMGTTWAPQSGFSPEADVPIGIHQINSPFEGRQAVREQIKYGADLIKIFMNTQFSLGGPRPDGTLPVHLSMTKEEESAIVNEAHRQGVKAACNAKVGEALDDSIDVGCDSIEESFVYTPEEIQKMAEKGIFMGMMLWNAKAQEASDLAGSGGKYSRLAMQKKSFAMALKAGVKIAFAPNVGNGGNKTVLLDHGQQAKELEYDVEYGMSCAQALRMVTLGGAELMGWQDRVGSIEKGKFADIIAVSGNPLDDITEMQRVKFVMKGGEVYRNDLR